MGTAVLVIVPQSTTGGGNRLMQDGNKNPDFALKSGLFVNAWANFSGDKKDPVGKDEAIKMVEDFYNLHKWLPRSYHLSNPIFRMAMRGAMKCDGKNDDWVIKSNDHHGGGIQIPKSADATRRLLVDRQDN